MEPTNILPIVAVLSLVSVEYGGWALLSFISGREGLGGEQLAGAVGEDAAGAGRRRAAGRDASRIGLLERLGADGDRSRCELMEITVTAGRGRQHQAALGSLEGDLTLRENAVRAPIVRSPHAACKTPGHHNCSAPRIGAAARARVTPDIGAWRRWPERTPRAAATVPRAA